MTRGATFGFVKSTNVTIFQGTDYSQTKSQPSYLWTTNPSQPPVRHVEYGYPSWFITVSNDAVCFPTLPRDPPVPPSSKWKDSYVLYWSDGYSFRKEKSDNDTSSSLVGHFQLLDFYPVDGILWFKDVIRIIHNGGDYGTMVWSLDPQSMVPTLHSERSKYIRPDGDDCSLDQVLRRRSILALFASAIPMMGLSIVLWKSKQMSSMVIASYLSLSSIYIVIQNIINPEPYLDEGPPYRLWFAVSGLVWLLASAYLILSLSLSPPPFWISQNHKEPLRAGLLTSAVAFSWDTSMPLMFNNYDDADTFGRWILWNLFVFLPLNLLGAATDSVGLLVMGGMGFLADSFRMASVEDSTLFFFLVFSLISLAVGFLGYFFILDYQPVIQHWSQAQVHLINQWLWNNHERYRHPQDTNTDNIDNSTLL
mmetsp:Transcript_8357/g.12121  ORF Transcript_8357/g.12121 Transcript_8357/m.12121 type:complete len:422 (+) Transcript_8357:734-1999(+)